MIPTDPDERYKLAQAVAGELNGSSGVYDNSVKEQHGLTDDEFEIMAEEGEVVRCSSCEWWVESYEVNEEGECEDCAND